jgi:pyruvate-ferredoxin/flavodoxin oxidoreductase
LTSFAASSLRLLRRLLQAKTGPRAAEAQAPVVLDGMSAVAITEAAIAQSAGLGAGFPAAAAARVFQRRQARQNVNQFGEPLAGVDAAGPRSALATALGLSLAGERAGVFLAGPDLIAAQDLLTSAAGRHLPLVIHLACRAAAGHAQALGAGHEAYMACADHGCLQLFALNVQEAVDLALIARRTAERALLPGIVAMDGEQTALAAQDVRFPDITLIEGYLGRPAQRIEPPTEAQRILFGEMRRQVPRFHDLEQPMMLGPLMGPESWGLGAAGARPYFHEHLPALLTEAFDAFAEQTGRRYGPLLAHRLEDARIVLVAQGSAVETAAAVADHVRAGADSKVGVLGVRCLRPFPAAEIVRRLRGANVVAVLERMDSSAADEGPLLREIRAAFDRAAEAPPDRGATRSDYPSVTGRERPRFISVPFGLGGLPLRAADLLALVRELGEPSRSLIYLGLDFTRPASAYPKRQALLDTLRRGYGDLGSLGLRSAETPPDIRPAGATTIAIHRTAGRELETLAGEAANLIHRLVSGHLRTRPALTWQRFDEPCVEYVTHAPGALRDPGDDVKVDIAIVAAGRIHRLMPLTERLETGGALLLVGTGEDEDVPASLPAPARRELQARNGRLFTIGLPGAGASTRPWHRVEALLGGLLALFLRRREERPPGTGKIRAAREATWPDLPEDERRRRVDVFIEAFESLREVEIAHARIDEAVDAPPGEIPTPHAVRHLSRVDTTLSCLPRFWDQTGVLYRRGETAELTADPYLAAAAIPPLSATFRDVSESRAVLPVFDPANCDGHARLWTSCPDGSIAPLVISARSLIDAGINLASAKGKSVDALRSVAGKLASRINRIVAAGDGPTTAAGLLNLAFDQVMEKSDSPEGQKAALRQALDVIIDEVGELPLARTPVFFDDAERVASGSGELLSLVVNPDACKSPEVVLVACRGRGLKEIEQTPQSIEAARRLWSLFQQLPDTSGKTIERVRAHPDVGPLGAMMLSRHCLLAMSGGDGAEAGSGAKLALRQVLAVAEYRLQPVLQQHLEEIEHLRGRIAERIRQVLAEALPTGDLDALAEGLAMLGRDDIDLAQLTEKVGSAVSSGHVDGAHLGRLVDAARGLADLHWRLSRGPDGLGRARLGLAIAPGSVAVWAGAFPYNPFACPVVIDAGGETSQLARGLIEGQIRHVLSGLRLLRWAKLELENPAEAAGAAEALASLRYGDLTAEERAACPPVLVVGDEQSLGGRGLSSLIGLLGSGLPVKVIVLSDIGGSADGALSVDSLGDYPAGQRFDLALLALLSRDAFVAQASVAQPDHFAEAVGAAIAFDGPALVHVHAPSPQRHGFPAERLHAQARLAVQSRAFPVFTFDPAAPGVFGSRLDLSANPDATSTWSTDSEGRPLTPADWAATEERFAEHLRALSSDDPAPTPIAEYLGLTETEARDRTPFVLVADGDEERRLRVDDVLLADATRRMRLWRTLQELAGVVTPFTKQVREAAERDLAEAHASEIAGLKAEYEGKIAELRATFEAEATQRVTSGLMALAGYGSPGRQREDEPS